MKINKKIAKLIIFLLSLSLYSVELFGVKKVITESPKKEMPLFSDQHNIMKSLSAMLEKVGPGGKVYLVTFMLTDREFVDSLIQAHKRGAIVNICVDRSSTYFSKNVFETLLQAGIEVHVYNGDFKVTEKNIPVKNHTKLLAWQYPIKESTTPRYRVALGSANHTKLSHVNKEHTTIIPDNNEIYQDSVALFYSAKANSVAYSTLKRDDFKNAWGKAKQEKTTKLVMNTPTKTKVVNSLTHNIIDTIAQRIAHTKKDGSILVNSYSLNNKNITQELIDAKKRGVSVQVITDKITLQKELEASEKNIAHESELQKLRKSNIPVKVYNRSGKNHCKTIEIERKDKHGTKTIVMEATGNLTDATNRDINALTIYPNNPELYTHFKNYHQRIESLSENYSPLKKQLIERKTRKADKENIQPKKRSCQRSIGYKKS